MKNAYRKIAEAHQMMAEAYSELAGENAKETTKAKKEAEVKEEPVSDSNEGAGRPKKITGDRLRELMRAKNKEGKMDKVQEALEKIGCGCVTDAEETGKLEELYKLVEVL